jgi:hypothetical protein
VYVYEIEGHVITSEDETLDGSGTVPDRITDSGDRVLEGAERQRFIDGMRTRLGVATVPGLSLPRLEGFFAASARARDYLAARGYSLGLQQAASAVRHARDGGFLSEATRAILRSLVEESIRPGLDAAEASLTDPADAREAWHLLNQEPFRSFRGHASYRTTTLQNLAREGILEEETLRRIGEVTTELIRRGIAAAPEFAREELRSGETPGDFRAAWMVVSGLRDAATLAGLSSDFTELDALIADLETNAAPLPEHLESLRRALE